jgi:hypothetical protein
LAALDQGERAERRQKYADGRKRIEELALE